MSGLLVSIGPSLPAAIGGVAVGWMHFRSLRTVAERLVAGRLSAVVLQVARLAALTLFLFICARVGAVPLLAAGAGVLAGRAVVMIRTDRGAA
jgi:hypothetical protein